MVVAVVLMMDFVSNCLVLCFVSDCLFVIIYIAEIAEQKGKDKACKGKN